MSDQDPSVEDWGWADAYPGPTTNADQAASTSATLRRLTGELDRLRADYNAVLLERSAVVRERDELAAAVERLLGVLAKSVEQRNDYLDSLTDVAKDLAAARLANDQLTRQLADRDPVAEPHWIVARDGGRNCERCEGEVRRGEAYELQDGTGGLLLHVHCPRPRKHLDAVKRERDEALAEVARLTARHARTYQLTDKGLAATAGPTPTEGEPPA